ncbi:hypothetical protein D0B54_16665 [Solimonas sp. K1W22B-7]|uniref:hypothetical protein n=1 Tax=Solimonas sp. K1W22B-7 TaxID=2303331 RepID=UPI000E32F1B0|nr:hypothetical protein [Solimonas sp. K1W22B-7]AXQ30207.1 hypothetical protein D0B54_16665 [Solimonas sp. K1W22B-7]
MSLIRCFGALACLLPAAVYAKPIAYQGGTTVMGEYGAGTMQELQVFYAPGYRWSLGAGHLRLDDEEQTFSREISYVRGNVLLKRWNLPRAQANVFAWGGVGQAQGDGFEGRKGAWNAGAQADYETLRVYGSLRTDWQYSREAFSHRIDTVQLGWAPYAHDWDRLATWFVIQGRDYTGGLYDGVEAAALLRLFKNGSWGAAWVEAGVTQDGKLQTMFMFNF